MSLYENRGDSGRNGPSGRVLKCLASIDDTIYKMITAYARQLAAKAIPSTQRL